MGWTVELDRAAVRDLRRLDRTAARRILTYLHGRVAALDDPRRIGEALKGSKLGRSLASSSGDGVFLHRRRKSGDRPSGAGAFTRPEEAEAEELGHVQRFDKPGPGQRAADRG